MKTPSVAWASCNGMPFFIGGYALEGGAAHAFMRAVGTPQGAAE